MQIAEAMRSIPSFITTSTTAMDSAPHVVNDDKIEEILENAGNYIESPWSKLP